MLLNIRIASEAIDHMHSHTLIFISRWIIYLLSRLNAGVVYDPLKEGRDAREDGRPSCVAVLPEERGDTCKIEPSVHHAAQRSTLVALETEQTLKGFVVRREALKWTKVCCLRHKWTPFDRSGQSHRGELEAGSRFHSTTTHTEAPWWRQSTPPEDFVMTSRYLKRYIHFYLECGFKTCVLT